MVLRKTILSTGLVLFFAAISAAIGFGGCASALPTVMVDASMRSGGGDDNIVNVGVSNSIIAVRGCVSGNLDVYLALPGTDKPRLIWKADYDQACYQAHAWRVEFSPDDSDRWVQFVPYNGDLKAVFPSFPSDKSQIPPQTSRSVRALKSLALPPSTNNKRIPY